MLVGKFRRIVFLPIILAAVGALSAFDALTPPPAFVVLDAGHVPNNSQIPPGWQLKVNSGAPDITFDHGDPAALHFKSVKSSYALERSVDIDPKQMPYLT